MTREYRLSFGRRGANFAMRLALKAGLAPRHYYLMGVRGRRSGRTLTTPVRIVENGNRYLVSPYGEVNWVKNVRATNAVSLSRRGRSRTWTAVEVGPQEAAPVLKMYLTQVPITRPFFDVRPDSPIDAFQAEAPRHPVFRLVERTPGDRF